MRINIINIFIIFCQGFFVLDLPFFFIMIIVNKLDQTRDCFFLCNRNVSHGKREGYLRQLGLFGGRKEGFRKCGQSLRGVRF